MSMALRQPRCQESKFNIFGMVARLSAWEHISKCAANIDIDKDDFQVQICEVADGLWKSYPTGLFSVTCPKLSGHSNLLLKTADWEIFRVLGYPTTSTRHSYKQSQL